MKDELFKKVFIKTEADLPKKEDVYFVVTNQQNHAIYPYDDDKVVKKIWMEVIDWYLLPIGQSGPVTVSDYSKQAEEISIRDRILEEAKKGNIVVYTIEGLMTMPLKDIVEQPIDGLLYDLNRDVATILTLIDDPKWINDYASTSVICELKSQIESFHSSGLRELSDDEIEKWAEEYSINCKLDIPQEDIETIFIDGVKWLRSKIEKK